MRLAVLSDVHSNLPALQAVLADVDRIAPDGIWVAGDLVGYNPWPNEVLEILRERHVRAIRGNHDRGAIGGDTSWFNELAAEGVRWTRIHLAPAGGAVRVPGPHAPPDAQPFPFRTPRKSRFRRPAARGKCAGGGGRPQPPPPFVRGAPGRIRHRCGRLGDPESRLAARARGSAVRRGVSLGAQGCAPLPLRGTFDPVDFDVRSRIFIDLPTPGGREVDGYATRPHRTRGRRRRRDRWRGCLRLHVRGQPRRRGPG